MNATVTLQQIQTLRKKVAGRKRRIVLHNDKRPFDRTEGSQRESIHTFNLTNFLYAPNTQVTTCTFSMIHQFGLAGHYNSKVATLMPGSVELDEKGRDSFQNYLDFCRENNLEAFWAMRMNDIHDMKESELDDPKGRFQLNPFKQNPENLLGTRDNRPPYGNAWTGVNYARDEIRQFVVDAVAEACRRDVDGILLDFNRHQGLFKTVAWGEPVKSEEIEMMTDLFRKIRRVMDEVGDELGKPILLAARLPDSIGFCKGMGIDLQTWLEEGLIDIWLATGNYRLREWEDTVRDGHKYGVQVWASLDALVSRQCRARGKRVCNSAEMFRARAMNAWNAGVDAIYLFNWILDSRYFMDEGHIPLFNQLGDPEVLEHMDKVYVGEVRNLDHGSPWNSAYLAFKGSDEFIERPVAFSPEEPEELGPGEGTELTLRVGENVAAVKAKGLTPSVSLKLLATGIESPGDLCVTLNGRELTNGERVSDRVAFNVAPERVKKGPNTIAINRADNGGGNITLRELQLWITGLSDS